MTNRLNKTLKISENAVVMHLSEILFPIYAENVGNAFSVVIGRDICLDS